MDKNIQITSMTPKAEIVNGTVQIHEYDDTVQTFEFRLGAGIPRLPICDELESRMRKFAEIAAEIKKISNAQERLTAGQNARMELWKFVAQVRDELDFAVKNG